MCGITIVKIAWLFLIILWVVNESDALVTGRSNSSFGCSIPILDRINDFLPCDENNGARFNSKHLLKTGSLHDGLLSEKRCSQRHCWSKSTVAMPISRSVLFHSLKFAAIVPLSFSSYSNCNAMDKYSVASSYDSYAASYDSLDGGEAASILGIKEARVKLLSKARGHVLEIGAGTGLNLASYQFQNISQLTLVDISPGMLQQARRKVEQYIGAGVVPVKMKVEFVQADATSQLTELFEEETFDTVVDTFSLCVMGNQGAVDCLRQISRVVKKKTNGGRILLLENSRSSNSMLGWYQDLTAETAATNGGKGCLYNQDVNALIKKSSYRNNKNTLVTLEENSFAAGLFRSFVCSVQTS